MHFIKDSEWKICVQNVPIFAIDLIIYFNDRKLLMGKRINNPAKNYFFVPGGRILKNESRKDAFKRITKDEIGKSFDINKSKFLGIYEHFYSNSIWEGTNISTHYIVEARYLKFEKYNQNKFNLSSQHSSLELIDLENYDPNLIHNYSLTYIKKLTKNLKFF